MKKVITTSKSSLEIEYEGEQPKEEVKEQEKVEVKAKPIRRVTINKYEGKTSCLKYSNSNVREVDI